MDSDLDGGRFFKQKAKIINVESEFLAKLQLMKSPEI